MPVFILIGAVGLAIVVLSLVLGEIFDGVFDTLDLDTGGGLFSAPVIGSFLASFGFGAALTMYSASVSAAMGTLGGLASGLVVGGAAYGITRSLINMETDPSVETADLVGRTAVVVTPIPDTGLGEVSLTHLGHLMKLSARAEGEVPAGTTVVVKAVLSSTSVLVERAKTA